MDNSKKLNLGFGISLSIIVMIGLISYINNNFTFHVFKVLTRTHDVIKKLNDISLSVNESEYRINNYIVVNQKNYLEDFYNTEDKINIQLNELEKVINDNKNRKEYIISLKKLIQSRYDFIIEAISTNTSQSNFRGDFTQDIFKLIKNIQEKERNLLLTSERRSKQNSSRSIYTIIIGSLFAFVIIFISMIIIKNELESRSLIEKKLRENEINLEKKILERTEKLTEYNNILNTEISERKKVEQSLLFSEIQLKANIKELESFSYSISHDLRSPLRSIDGFSQAIYEDYYDLLDEDGKDYIQRTRAATQRMGVLIDDILNLSKITRVDINIKNINLSEIAYSIIEDLKRYYPERKVECIIKNDVFVFGDKSLLTSVLDNLIGNAWKFTSKNEHAVIEFGTIEKENKIIYFVRDNGVGFDMKYYDKLFGVFQRLHTFEDFKGTGVGLASVQKIIFRHGGEVWADSKVNDGSVFYFTITLNKG